MHQEVTAFDGAPLLLPICLGACGESETPSRQQSELQDQMKADADLMSDIFEVRP
jgi:hypothetical protein